MSGQAIARKFVEALDREAFGVARACLADGCVYTFRGATIEGADAIIASYEAAAVWARESFDSIAYESALSAESERVFRVRYADLTEHKGVSHRHECEQVFELGEDGLVVRIEHVDLPGERERLDAFLARVGVERR